MSLTTGPFKIILSAPDGITTPVTPKLTVVERLMGTRSRFGPAEAGSVIPELAKLLEIDGLMAESILHAVPIVILDGLDGRTAEVVRERLSPLKQAGCQVVVTDAPTQTIPRINWPEPPSITRL